MLDDHNIPIPRLRATKDHLPGSRGLYRAAGWGRDIHASV
jgi:hypothetical protein